MKSTEQGGRVGVNNVTAYGDPITMQAPSRSQRHVNAVQVVNASPVIACYYPDNVSQIGGVKVA